MKPRRLTVNLILVITLMIGLHSACLAHEDAVDLPLSEFVVDPNRLKDIENLLTIRHPMTQQERLYLQRLLDRLSTTQVDSSLQRLVHHLSGNQIEWEPGVSKYGCFYTLIPHRPDRRPLDFDRLLINASGVTLSRRISESVTQDRVFGDSECKMIKLSGDIDSFVQLLEARSSFAANVSRVVVNGTEYSGQRILVVLELLVAVVDDDAALVFPARSVSTFDFR